MRKGLPRFIKAVGRPTGCWITQWRKHAFDEMYPDYQASEPAQFRALLSELGNLDSLALPYINACLFDERIGAGADIKGLVTDRFGSTVSYNKKLKYLKYACLASRRWRNTIVDARRSLVDEDGELSGGVYYDMLAAAAPKSCFSQGHEHRPGDIQFWPGAAKRLLLDTPGVKMVRGKC